MQVEGTRMYRVTDVAAMVDVEVSTIYRAIRAGVLSAYKIGSGKGAMRIPGHAVTAYLQECARAACSSDDAATDTGPVNGHPVRQVHRSWRVGLDPWPAVLEVTGTVGGGDVEPVVVTVSAPISLSLDDLAVVLFDGAPCPEDLADDDTIRILIAEQIVNLGCYHVEALLHRLQDRSALTSEEAEYLASCRQRAATVFGPERELSMLGPEHVGEVSR